MVADRLQLVDPSGFMVSMAEAAAIAGKGIGVDYGSNPSKAVFGLSISTGVNAQGIELTRPPDSLPTAGFAFQASAMAGVNLGLLAPNGEDGEDGFLDRFVVSAHGMWLESPAGQRVFQGTMYNVGGHVTFKAIGQGSKGIFEFGGLDLTTGFERATYQLELASGLPIDAGDATWDATGAFDLAVTMDSVPIEVSTNIRASVVTLIVGGGADANLGGATATASLDGPIVADGTTIGTGSVSVSSEGEAQPMAFRGFAGLQINVLAVKAYGMVQASSRGSAAVQAGIRVSI
jgi:hypothetical protein